ncbi:coiled-coil domain-containing protein 22 [Mammaliicoccus sciuri]|uniref:coiled-coil domain-containing protein 22 n=1 Tax=Mammaliicoccus sciuri TaxID=1296 RepID=UPI001E4B1A2F|nr:coiled-coil domain-containing protein 22 [Mammaliicoccus sciuri]MCD8898351.1 coiled-coil domain-containing protein 22 [Mammaliicoccus sciuri]
MSIEVNLPNEDKMKKNNEIVKRKVREKEQREIENTENIKSIKVTVQYMASELPVIMENLIILNTLIENSSKDYEEVLSELKEHKHIEADIYSVLMQSKIENEKDRINTTKKLAKVVESGINVSAGLASIFSLIPH